MRNVSLKEKHFVAGAVAGWKNTKNEEETYTDPGFTEEETYTDPGYTEE
ncbi:MAG: hypothetical protein LBP53_04585 [Candidatus Peribacteria bacterium]|nr:hypothetical protein [Candidatus Peribacteria bacterium]